MNKINKVLNYLQEFKNSSAELDSLRYDLIDEMNDLEELSIEDLNRVSTELEEISELLDDMLIEFEDLQEIAETLIAELEEDNDDS